MSQPYAQAGQRRIMCLLDVHKPPAGYEGKPHATNGRRLGDRHNSNGRETPSGPAGLRGSGAAPNQTLELTVLSTGSRVESTRSLGAAAQGGRWS